ncbi:MAG: replicative DNA helicase, partial [Clostridiaceae bacterium]|nr:replicative DNA helicase [Clostridiaceae bacterium]
MTELNLLGKIPPQNIEAEQSVLGSMLLDKDLIPGVIEILKKDDFYREDHAEIFEAIINLFDRAEPIDIITVSEKLKERGTLDKVGGLEYITNIATGVHTTANAKY